MPPALAALFFLQMMASGMWLVPLSHVLEAHGMARFASYAYATYALSAFVSPLIFGAMADRHASPVVVLRGLAVASASGVTLASWSLARGFPPAIVLACTQLYTITAVATSSITSTIVFSQLRDSQRQFGPIRAMATLGWMTGCWLISGLKLDASPGAGYACAVIWAAVAAFTYIFPAVPPPPARLLTFRERMGWDALALLRHRDHGVVFITVAMFSVPVAAFYPYTPPHLQELGLQRTSAWMSLGQVTEIIAMFCLAGLLSNWRLKWILATGLFFGMLRFGLCALDQKPWLLLGVSLHGISFALVFITAQIYLNERVDSVWRARAQALMSLMSGGLGNLAGYLGSGLWFRACMSSTGTRWPVFWSGVATLAGCVLLFFLIAKPKA
jgi:MFS family permease